MESEPTMLRVIINQILHTGDGDRPHLLAQFKVDEHGIHPEAGDRTQAITTIPLIDPENGERLQSKDDPLRWARLLPLELRAGDLAVSVKDATEATEAARRDPIAELVAESSAETAELTH
jgi:hypothetical protein